jgi:hypothetical protein
MRHSPTWLRTRFARRIRPELETLEDRWAPSTTYYVDNVNGNDSNAGTSTGAAWASVAHVNSVTFSAGDQILFARGQTWRETLVPPSSGTTGGSAGNITFGAFGTGAAPIITGGDLVTTWSLYSGSIYSSTTFLAGGVTNGTQHGYSGGVANLADPAFNSNPNQLIAHTWDNGTLLTAVSSLANVNSAGKFYWDYTNKKLYVWLSSGANPSSHTMEVDVRANAINMNTKSYLTFTNLSLSNTMSYQFNIWRGASITLSNSTLKNGSDAVQDGGSPNLVVDTITYTLDSGYRNFVSNYFAVLAGIEVIGQQTNNADGAIIRNSTFDFTGVSGTQGVYLQDLNNGQVYANTFTDVSIATQIWAMNEDNTGAQFYDNYITNVDNSHGDGEAIEFTGNDGTYGSWGKAVHSATGSAFRNFIQGGTHAVGGIDGWRSANCAVYDNILDGNFMAADLQWTSHCTNLVAYNNTIYGNNSNDAIEIYTSSTATIENNIISTIRAAGIADGNDPTVTVSEDYNIIYSVTTVRSTSITPGAHDSYGDPLFVSNSPSTPFDFHLKGGSPAIDNGINLGTPYNMVMSPLDTTFPNYTMDQNAYGSGWERGAFGFTQSMWTSSATYNVNETAGFVTITVVRSNGSDGTVSVQYGTSDGTAHAGTDYTATSGTLTFAPGVTSMTFQVPIINDGITDPGTLSFNIALSNPGGGAFLGTRHTSVVNITKV